MFSRYQKYPIILKDPSGVEQPPPTFSHMPDMDTLHFLVESRVGFWPPNQMYIRPATFIHSVHHSARKPMEKKWQVKLKFGNLYLKNRWKFSSHFSVTIWNQRQLLYPSYPIHSCWRMGPAVAMWLVELHILLEDHVLPRNQQREATFRLMSNDRKWCCGDEVVICRVEDLKMVDGWWLMISTICKICRIMMPMYLYHDGWGCSMKSAKISLGCMDDVSVVKHSHP